MSATMVDVFDLPAIGGEVLERDESTLPDEVGTWLGTLVYAPKRDYAEAFARYVFGGEAEPADPGTDWARKARGKVGRFAHRLTARAPQACWHIARDDYQCTRCSAVIGKGDEYVRRSTPAWLTEDGKWSTEVLCWDVCGPKAVTT